MVKLREIIFGILIQNVFLLQKFICNTFGSIKHTLLIWQGIFRKNNYLQIIIHCGTKGSWWQNSENIVLNNKSD